MNGTTITISKNGSSTPKPTDYIQFEDVNVKALCLKWDTNYDGELSYEEAAKVQSLGKTFYEKTSIRLFKELQYFTGISSLESSFYGCTGLVFVIIPSTVKTMKGTFSSCSSLIRVTIPNSVTELDGTFYGCKSLSSITIPNSVVKIGDETFSECSKLTSLSFPNSVTSIGEYVVYNCSNLKTIYVGNGIKTIGEYAFRLASSSYVQLESFYCKATIPPTIGTDIFCLSSIGTNYCPSIYVPHEAVDSYKTANNWTKYRTGIQGYNFEW